MSKFGYGDSNIFRGENSCIFEPTLLTNSKKIKKISLFCSSGVIQVDVP